MKECLDELADMVAMPHIGDSQNNYVPSAQLNIARSQLNESSKMHNLCCANTLTQDSLQVAD